MSSRTMSLACLSEARSTIRRARLKASALSGAWLGSPANREWLSMSATIALDVPSLGLEFVNGSGGPDAGLIQRQARGDRVQECRADQHLAELPPHRGQLEVAIRGGKAQIARLGERARPSIDKDPGAGDQRARQLTRGRGERAHGIHVRPLADVLSQD